mmetsp:Transcript_9466/g.27180  ORF Transcript_9466/g.27180 Transcript_9466/m.27180 type:complete len:113 (-) Transcript_9466:98-436(-)
MDISKQCRSVKFVLCCQFRHPHFPLQIILNQKGVDKNARTIQGNTPLHLACLNSREKACVLLVSHGADLDPRNSNGLTPADVCPLGAESIRQFLQNAAMDRERRTDVEIDEV